jgi:cystathionine gamma-synthase
MSLDDRWCSAAEADFAELRSACGAVRGELDVPLSLRNGGEVSAALRYELVGSGTRLLIVGGGISAGRHVVASPEFPDAGWWQPQAQSFDLSRCRLLAIDWVGADGRLDVPIDASDQADAIAALLDHLGIDRADAFIGASYGGMVALHFAARHATRCRCILVISASASAHPFASALRSLQRRALALGEAGRDPGAGVALARAMAMATYRTPEEFRERFDAEPTIAEGRVRVGADDYLDHHGRRHSERMGSVAYRRLSESIDLHRVDPAGIAVPSTFAAVDSDALVPAADVESLATAVCGARFRLIRSKFGHDAFLKEERQIAALITDFLQSLGDQFMTFTPVTRAVRAGIDHDRSNGAVIPPITLSATFRFDSLDEKPPYEYTRSGNPTRDVLAGAIADLEGGAGAVVTATGMAAIATVLHALLAPGERLLAPHDCYGGSWRLFAALAAKGLFEFDSCDFTDPAAVAAALERRPQVVWLETPSNPLLRITDLGAVIAAAQAAGALTVADNTFLSPALQRPIEFGADVVVHSTTKYINGHSDVVGGAAVARDPALLEQLAYWANALGVTGSPFDSYLTLRGLRTLNARMRIHQENAAALAGLVAAHPAVARVHYPGLADHPGHEIAARQQDGFGAMLSIDLAGGEAAVRAFVDGLTCFTLAESLGGIESLVAYPVTMSHAAMSDEARDAAGIGPGLLRLSVGIEDVRDLAADVGAALDRALAASKEQVRC